jgi:hypothetical protein
VNLYTCKECDNETEADRHATEDVYCEACGAFVVNPLEDTAAKVFYRNAIEQAAAQMGGKSVLGKYLGVDPSLVKNTLLRGELMSLRRMFSRIREARS